MIRFLLSTLLLWTALPPAPHVPQKIDNKITVAAAADLKFAMDSLVRSWSVQPGAPRIDVIYGSSGNFFEQISNGAPFDLFFSADLEYPQKLKQQNKTLGDIKEYGIGQLVLWSKKLDPAAKGIETLNDPGIVKIAIANPAHAPYGKRAEETLKYYRLYDQLKVKLVMGENISQTAEFARTGAADIGMIALSLALSPAMRQTGKYWIIPESAHQPLRQAYTLLQHAKDNPGAARFAAFIETPAARAILHNFGFSHD